MSNLSPIANPLADEKVAKRLFKLIKKGVYTHIWLGDHYLTVRVCWTVASIKYPPDVAL